MRAGVSFYGGGGDGSGGSSGGGTTNYAELSNRPKINGMTLSGDQTGAQLGLAEIAVVSELPDTCVENTIYIVRGDPTADPPTYDSYYIYKGGHLYQMDEVDYEDDVTNKPKINNITIEGNKKGTDYDLTEIKVVPELPGTLVENTIYVVPGNALANPPTYDSYYVYKGGHLYQMDEVDYEGDVINKPKINDIVIDGNKKGTDYNLAEVKVVSALPATRVDDTIYVVTGNPSGTPPTYNDFFIHKNGTTYKVAEVVDYDEDIINRPKINHVTLEGDKTGPQLGLAEIKVLTVAQFNAAQLAASFTEDTLYIVPADLTLDPPVTDDNYYIFKGGHLYKMDSVDYVSDVYNKPEIDSVELMPDQTHEDLELISEKDFTTAFSGKTDGMEFVLPAGTPDNPIELTEIDDSPEMKYAENLTSSNRYINTEIDALKLLIDKKIQVLVVSELPDSFVNNTLYVIPGDPGDGTVTPGVFYLYKGNTLYLVGGSGGDVDYELEVHNKPEIDNVELMPNQTHEDLELISEKDFVTQSTNKTDGIEFILPEGTPDSPIEITEINDSVEAKYANNYTSSNLYINTALDAINRILDGKVQVLVVSALPAQPAKNTIYFVETSDEGVYSQYIVDSVGTVHSAGNTQLNLNDYVKNTLTVGSHSLEHNITSDDLVNDVKNQTATLTNKTISADSNTIRDLVLNTFASGVVQTSMPASDTNEQILTASAIKQYIAAELDDRVQKTRKVGTNSLASDVTATNLANDIKDETVTFKNKTLNATNNTITNLKITNFASGIVATSMASSPTDTTLLTAKAISTFVKGTRATGNNAFTYNPNKNQGYTISGDYATDIPRQISKVGRRVNLSFCCKGSATAAGAAWTTIGTVPAGYRPATKTSITAQIYNSGSNEAAGGYVTTDGSLVLWTNAKIDGNNYQVRVNACWDVE